MRGRLLIVGSCLWAALGCVAQPGVPAAPGGRGPIPAGILQVLKAYETAYNERRVEGILAAFHDNGHIVSEGSNTLFPAQEFYKDQFAQIFPPAMRQHPTMVQGDPVTFMMLDSGDKAVLDLTAAFGGRQVRAKVSFMLEEQGWLIWKIRYF
jgi:hypothetical protein